MADTLGISASVPALLFGVVALAGGIGLAYRFDRCLGYATIFGGLVVASFALTAIAVAEFPEPDRARLPPWIVVITAGILARLIALRLPMSGVSVLAESTSILAGVGVVALVDVRADGAAPLAIPLVTAVVATDGLARAAAGWALLLFMLQVSSDVGSQPVWGLAGVVAFVVALAELWRRWQSRRAAWLTEPEHLLARLALPRWISMAICVLGVLAFTVASIGSTVLTTGTLALATIGVLTVGHLSGRLLVSELGLALAAATLAAVVVLFAGPAALPAATALAGLWMMWLARFWHQQLVDGVPWTTAGRLIPSARRIGATAAFATLILSWKHAGSGGFWTIAGLILALALVAALAVAARRERCGGSAIGALAAGGAAAILALGLLPDATPAFLAPPIGAAIAAVLGWPAAGSRNKDGEMARAAWIGIGAVTLIGLAISRPEEPQLFVAASITLAAGLLLAALSRRSPAPVDSQS